MKSHTAHAHSVLSAKPVLALTAAVAFGLAVTACVSPSKPRVVIYEDLRGAVYLGTMPDGAFQASHPISLGPAVIARLLRGVQVQEQQGLLQTLVTGEAIPLRAFSDEETTFLTPHIATALSRATDRQLVGFEVLHTTAIGTETTGGVLYASDHSLHVTVTHYRYRAEKPSPGSKPGRQLPDPTGLDQRRILFLPKSAQRAAAETPSAFSDSPPHWTVVVDYEALTQLPDAQPKPTPSLPQSDPQRSNPAEALAPVGTHERPSATSEELQSMRALIEKQAKALEALQDEVSSLRHQQKLTNTEATPPKPKAKKGAGPQKHDSIR